MTTPSLGRRLIALASGCSLLAYGWLMDPDGPGPEMARAVCYTRDIADALGLVNTWDPTEPAITLARPGAITKESGESEG